MGSLASPLATVGILSIGDMGLGIAKLLKAHNYRVTTNAADRSQATQDRARKNGIILLPNDIELARAADYILSIVPPRDALATAQRIADVASHVPLKERRPLYYLDLNAISPRSAREIGDLFAPNAASLRYVDGGIIGGPPKSKEDGTWSRPSVPVSGPHRLEQAPVSGQHLAQTLNIRHINETIGSAKGLKMCFASLSKGFTALAIQSLTTAHSLGVGEDLMCELEARNPGARKQVESVTNMAPKAYRWVREMEEIAETFEADGGFEGEESVFRPIARVYDLVANGTELGLERTEERKRGKTTEDVALLMRKGIAKRKEKVE
ncbi:6-phosphogluconate dehydrogenase C-terminal domain-like protein [Teratosphaeria nubilosa]|uniref:6-phosphogluconate dehydrogenase C-terminal domain-like protein n=1 Tax=Teratosphaeria nubilosa TaxID=161662 RepID=A0A6G1LC50_9PEZI|nr:6-phosphogluconate dehydrogenase C-terminal domain-like protein [Teratosphaeria nubilosa]